MNYLAHATLSFHHPGILVGNMISDFVKGKKKLEYPLSVQHGITLHRLIDSFTDQHPATKEAKKVFQPVYRLYSGAFVDVAYDHFLAIDVQEYTASSLLEFTQWVYGCIDEHITILPLGFAGIFPYMKEQNWLFHYKTIEGIHKSFTGLVRRAAYLSESRPALNLFEQHYQLLQDCYRHFWKDIQAYAWHRFEELAGNDHPGISNAHH